MIRIALSLLILLLLYAAAVLAGSAQDLSEEAAIPAQPVLVSSKTVMLGNDDCSVSSKEPLRYQSFIRPIEKPINPRSQWLKKTRHTSDYTSANGQGFCSFHF